MEISLSILQILSFNMAKLVETLCITLFIRKPKRTIYIIRFYCRVCQSAKIFLQLKIIFIDSFKHPKFNEKIPQTHRFGPTQLWPSNRDDFWSIRPKWEWKNNHPLRCIDPTQQTRRQYQNHWRPGGIQTRWYPSNSS